MICQNCSETNAIGSNYCSNCGQRLAPPQPTGEIFYGVFYHRKFAGYATSFGCLPTIEEVLQWQNSPTVLSLSKPSDKFFLAEVTVMALLPTDVSKHITTRLAVKKWWKLEWKNGRWVQGKQIRIFRPYTIGI